MGQRRRSKFLKENFSKLFGDSGCIEIIPQLEVNLDEFMGEIEYKDYNKKMVADGFEGIMIKDPEAKYECKRSTSWLKEKPFLEVSLSITAVEEGTGRNVGRLGALVCQGVDDGKSITVNVGSGFSDGDRASYWEERNTLAGQVVEVRADAITQNQDGTYSLRFPRFIRFRGFIAGEKI
jgi:DNA ligase-1